MLQYGTVFLIIALFAAIFGIGALAVGAAEFSGTLFLAFIGLSIGGLAGMLFGRPIKPDDDLEPDLGPSHATENVAVRTNPPD